MFGSGSLRRAGQTDRGGSHGRLLDFHKRNRATQVTSRLGFFFLGEEKGRTEMNMRRWIALLLAVGMLAAPPAALAYNDTLPAMAVWEGGTHDGDPDEPTHFTAGGQMALMEQDSSRGPRGTATGWSLVVKLLLHAAEIAR